jgi:hypothetical protein
VLALRLSSLHRLARAARDRIQRSAKVDATRRSSQTAPRTRRRCPRSPTGIALRGGGVPRAEPKTLHAREPDPQPAAGSRQPRIADRIGPRNRACGRRSNLREMAAAGRMMRATRSAGDDTSNRGLLLH